MITTTVERPWHLYSAHWVASYIIVGSDSWYTLWVVLMKYSEVQHVTGVSWLTETINAGGRHLFLLINDSVAHQKHHTLCKLLIFQILKNVLQSCNANGTKDEHIY